MRDGVWTVWDAGQRRLSRRDARRGPGGVTPCTRPESRPVDLLSIFPLGARRRPLPRLLLRSELGLRARVYPVKRLSARQRGLPKSQGAREKGAFTASMVDTSTKHVRDGNRGP